MREVTKKRIVKEKISITIEVLADLNRASHEFGLGQISEEVTQAVELLETALVKIERALLEGGNE